MKAMRFACLLTVAACVHPGAHTDYGMLRPAADEACLPDGAYGKDGNLRYSAMAPDERSLSYCLVDHDDEKKRSCLRYDLETGAFHDLGELKIPDGEPGPEFYPPAEETQPTATVNAADSQLDVCKRGKSDCKSIPFDPPVHSENVSATVDPTGAIAALVFDLDSGSAIVTFDVEAGKPLATIRVPACAEAQMLGTTLFVNQIVCDKPGASAILFDPKTGKAIGPVADGANTYQAMPQHLDGDRWAVDDMGGKHVFVVDENTAKTEQTISLPPIGDTDNVVMDIGADDTLLLVYDTGDINLVDVKKGSAATVRPRPCKK
jgi:hypothetical protein